MKAPANFRRIVDQRQIVSKVDQLMALVDALETQLGASRATGKNLLTALVAELTSQSNSSRKFDL